MNLNVSVPEISARQIGAVELRPAKVEKWLAQLPLLNVVETGRKLHSNLSVYNRMEIDAAVRLQLLELYRYAVKQVSLELHKRYAGLPLPLAERHKHIAEQNAELQREMAYGYKHILRHSDPPSESAGSDRDALALTIARAIQYLTEELTIAYLSYSPHAKDAWREIHNLYRHAAAVGVADIALGDTLNPGRTQMSVTDVYKQVLLLDLADPYHLPARMIAKTAHYLERWAHLAHLVPASERYEPTCQFLIDMNADRAGTVYMSDATLAQPDAFRLLNTVDLARTIHAHLTILNSEQLPEPEGLPADFFRDGGYDLLVRLINVWGVNPKRVWPRTERTKAAIEVVVGIDAIGYWVNNREVFLPSASNVGPESPRTVLGAGAKKSSERPAAEHAHSTWQIEDEGAGGMALTKQGLVGVQVRVGDVLAVRVPELNPDWAIATIRWVKSPNPSSIRIGIQRVAARAQPVLIKIVADNNESDFVPALLLPEIAALNEPQTLICPRGTYKPKRTLYLDNGYRLYRIAATRAIEVTGGFERFAFDARG